MPTTGQKLRSERESQGLTRADVARATRVRAHQLAALEHDDFESIPDVALTARYVWSYAGHLGLDPDVVLTDLARELGVELPAAAELAEKAHARALGESETNGAATEPTPTEEPPRPTAASAETELAEPTAVRPTETGRDEPAPVRPLDRAARSRPPVSPFGSGVILISAAIVLLAFIAWWVGSSRRETPSPTVAPAAEPATTLTAETGVEPVARPDPPNRESRAPQHAAPAPRPTPAAGRLSVSAHGVSAGEDRDGSARAQERFIEGQRAWFWTHVQGGRAGDRIRHVWMREGRVIDTIALAVDGPSWRTRSRKTLYPGSAGRWTVEARDGSGRVLARSEFVCTRG